MHGRLVPVGDPAALAGAIVDLVSEPALRERYGSNVAALTDAIPAWGEIARRTIAIYEGLRGEAPWLAPGAGLEPATQRLTAACSTN